MKKLFIRIPPITNFADFDPIELKILIYFYSESLWKKGKYTPLAIKNVDLCKNIGITRNTLKAKIASLISKKLLKMDGNLYHLRCQNLTVKCQGLTPPLSKFDEKPSRIDHKSSKFDEKPSKFDTLTPFKDCPKEPLKAPVDLIELIDIEQFSKKIEQEKEQEIKSVETPIIGRLQKSFKEKCAQSN